MEHIFGYRVNGYSVTFDHELDGVYFATVPALPGCIAEGNTWKEALENTKEAIRLWIQSEKDYGHDIPVLELDED